MYKRLFLIVLFIASLGCGDESAEIPTAGQSPVEEGSPAEVGTVAKEEVQAEAMPADTAADVPQPQEQGVVIGRTGHAVCAEITLPQLAQDWQHVVTLPRQNLAPHKFRVTDEWIDSLVSAYVAGKDFLFVIYKEKFIRQQFFFMDQPQPPPQPQDLEEPVRRIWHFLDPEGWWFQHWDRAGRPRENTGFTVDFDTTPMPEPEIGEKEREYLHAPEFGTSLEGWGVGEPGAPEIKEGFQLKIYTR